MAFYEIEPFGLQVTDELNARLMHLFASLWSKKNSKLKDFLAYPEPTPPQSENEMKNILKMHERSMKQGNK